MVASRYSIRPSCCTDTMILKTESHRKQGPHTRPDPQRSSSFQTVQERLHCSPLGCLQGDNVFWILLWSRCGEKMFEFFWTLRIRNSLEIF